MTAMLSEVGKRGYQETSVQAVLKLASTSRRAFYENFANKGDCFQAAYQAAADDLIDQMLAATRSSTTWHQQLQAALDSLLTFLDREPAIATALFVEVHAAGPQVAVQRIAVMRRLAKLVSPTQLDDGAESGTAVTADGVVGGIDSAIRTRLRDETGWGCRELLPELMYFVVLAFEGPEAAIAELERVGTSD
jgi:AcrR family transcriptional regulator